MNSKKEAKWLKAFLETPEAKSVKALEDKLGIRLDGMMLKLFESWKSKVKHENVHIS